VAKPWTNSSGEFPSRWTEGRVVLEFTAEQVRELLAGARFVDEPTGRMWPPLATLPAPYLTACAGAYGEAAQNLRAT